MLKHLKLKAAMSSQQEDPTENREMLLSEGGDDEASLARHGEHLEGQNVAPSVVHSSRYLSDPLDASAGLFLSNRQNEGAMTSGSSHNDVPSRFCNNGIVTSPDTERWGHLASTHYDLGTQPHSSELLYNKTTCLDPRYHYSPSKMYPISPKMDHRGSCINCQQMPKMMHLSSTPCFHSKGFPEGSPPFHQPSAGMFYSPDHNYVPHKSLFPSPVNQGGMAWARFADTGLNPTANLFNISPYHLHNQWKFPEPTSSSEYIQGHQMHSSHQIPKLSLPLERANIITLVKGGKCDMILEVLDGPLHDESSPQYTLALQTVLEILDVIEKEFSNAYQDDRKVESDIHNLSKFVRNMRKSTYGESSINKSKRQSAVGEWQSSSAVNSAAQCPDISSLSSDTPKIEASSTKEHIFTTKHDTTPVPNVGAKDSGRVVILLDNPSEIQEPTQTIAEDDSGESFKNETAHKLAFYKAQTILQPQRQDENDNNVYRETEMSKEDESHKRNKQTALAANPNCSKGSNFWTDLDSQGMIEDNVSSSKKLASTASEKKNKEEDGKSQLTSQMESVNSFPVLEVTKEQNMEESGALKIIENKLVESEMEMDVEMESVPKEATNISNSESSREAEGIKEIPLDVDDVDALLDETLYKADRERDKRKEMLKKSVSDESLSKTDPAVGSLYRGKGYKVRAVVNSDKYVVKPKVAVKTFAQSRENDSLMLKVDLNNKSTTVGKACDQPLHSENSVANDKKDENGNVLNLPSLAIQDTKGEENESKQGPPPPPPPDVPRCPSNPLSPSHSDSLDSTDLKPVCEKSNSEAPSIPLVIKTEKAGIVNKNSVAVPVTGNPMKPPLSQGALQSGCGKPLISKSFHGKLLLQKHSKEPPYPIPLEISEVGLPHRDPRLALSNLMDHQRVAELKIVRWKVEDEITVPENPANQLGMKVRDPRIRRRISVETNLPVSALPSSTKGNGVLKPSLASGNNDPLLELPQTDVVKSVPSVLNQNTVCPPSTIDTGVSNVIGQVSNTKEMKTITSGENRSTKDGGIFTPSVLTERNDQLLNVSKANEVKPNIKNCNTPGEFHKIPSQTRDLHKSSRSVVEKVTNQVYVPAEEKERIVKSSKEMPQNPYMNVLKSKIVHGNTGSILYDSKKAVKSVITPVKAGKSIEDVDTIFSFQEALSVLKSIKGDIKKELTNANNKLENISKDKTTSLTERLSVLKKAVEISLLTTEVQQKKAIGRRSTILNGVLEDHFILTADLIILCAWFKGGGKEKFKDMTDFKTGVFSRRSAPELKKIHKWLKNRYELDGFSDEGLLQLVSIIKEDHEGNTSRSRSSSADKNKRRRSDCSHSSGKSHKKSSEKNPETAPSKTSEESKKDKSSDRKGSVTSKRRSPSPKKKRSDSASANVKSDKNDPSKKKVSTSNSPPGSDAESTKQSESGMSSSSDSEGGKSNSSSETGNSSSKKRKGDVTIDDERATKKKKQSVTVSSGIQDLPEEMENLRKEVLIALKNRNTKIANQCLEDLPEISRKAHAQLEDENKTYMSLKNVSPDTKAKFQDVIKGIQRLIVDCEILIYSLSWKANKAVAREAKDTIWTIALKSSHKPSYEEELALLLSLRKSYLTCDLWKYIKMDVDDRIESLQKKCRSRDVGIKSPEYPSHERNNLPWPNVPPMPQYISTMVPELPTCLPIPPMQSAVQMEYNSGPNMGYNGYQNNMVPMERNGPSVGQYPPAGTVPYVNDYQLRGPAPQQNFQHHQQFPPREQQFPPREHQFPPREGPPREQQFPPREGPPREQQFPPREGPPREGPRNYEWQRYNQNYDDWETRSVNSSTGSLDYNSRNAYTPPMML